MKFVSIQLALYILRLLVLDYIDLYLILHSTLSKIALNSLLSALVAIS